MESFDPQQQPLTINDDVEIVIDNDQQSLQQQRQQSIRSHSQQSTILKTGYNQPSTPIIQQQQQQQSGIINRKSLQKRPTPPLPVELIRPPIVNQHLEELITSMFYIFILLFQKKNQCFFPCI